MDAELALLRVSCRGPTFLDHRGVHAEDPDIDDYAHFKAPRVARDIADDLAGYMSSPHGDDAEIQSEHSGEDFERGYGGGYEGGYEDGCGGSDGASDGGGSDRGWSVEFKPTFADKKHSSGSGKSRAAHVNVDVRAPAVVARGSPPTNFVCACCGQGCGYTLQMPWNVYCTAFRVHGGAHAVSCVVAMASMLERGETRDVLKRVTVCKDVSCMLSMDMLEPEQYAAWMATDGQRPQLERGTARKSQSTSFMKNADLFRALYRGTNPILTAAKVEALFEYVVLNSQYIQEREKKFIATAMAAVDNPNVFHFKFPDPQRLVDRMARLPRYYALRVILPHLLDGTLNEFRWNAKSKRVFETASPKAPDALYALMADINAEVNGYEKEDGRFVHRIVSALQKNVDIFTAAGFEEALGKAVEASPQYTLCFSAGGASLSTVGGKDGAGKGAARYKVHELLRILEGSERRATTTACGAVAAPTCGSLQYDSGVHTHERYMAVFTAEGFSEEEARARTAIFVDKHAVGNFVGKEALGNARPGSKACHALRPLSRGIAFGYNATSAPTSSSRMRLNQSFVQIVPISKPRRR